MTKDWKINMEGKQKSPKRETMCIILESTMPRDWQRLKNFLCFASTRMQNMSGLNIRIKKLPEGAVVGGIFDGYIHYVGKGQSGPPEPTGETAISPVGMFLPVQPDVYEMPCQVSPHVLYAPLPLPFGAGDMQESDKFEVLVVRKDMDNSDEVSVVSSESSAVPSEIMDFFCGKVEGSGMYEENEAWKLFNKENKEDRFNIPDGYKIVEVDDTNYDDYRERIESLIKKELRNGTMKFAKKVQTKEKNYDLVLASTGEVARLWPNMLGTYKVTGEKNSGKPCWKREDGSAMLYFSDEFARPQWLVRPAIGKGEAGLRHIGDSPLPPSQGWEFGNKEGGAWRWCEADKEDSSLTVTLLSEKPQEEVSLGDLVGMMGSLMTAFVPEGEAQKLQGEIDQMAQLLSPLKMKVDPKTSEDSTED